MVIGAILKLALVARIQVAAVEARELPEPVQIVDLDGALPQGEQFALTQLTQDAVDMNGGQTQRVGENELAKRTLEFGLGRQSDQARAFRQLHEEMSRALDRIAPPDADEVLDDHRLVTGRRPHKRRPQAWKLTDAFHDVRALNWRDHRIRQSGEGMVRSFQQDTFNATMSAARRLNHVETIQQQDSASNALNKLARTFAAQLEALKRYRSSGEPTVKTQNVTVNDGGQAIVGNVQHGGDDANQNRSIANGQPCAAPAPVATLLGDVQEVTPAMSGAGGEGQEGLPVPRRPCRRAKRSG
jgi:hypothetical protein